MQAGASNPCKFCNRLCYYRTVPLGLNGYWLKQVTDTEVDGEKSKGRRESKSGQLSGCDV